MGEKKGFVLHFIQNVYSYCLKEVKGGRLTGLIFPKLTENMSLGIIIIALMATQKWKIITDIIYFFFTLT